MDQSSYQLTAVVSRWQHGCALAERELYQEAYLHFRSIARNMRDKTLGSDPNTYLKASCNTTSLVHDAFIRANGAARDRCGTSKGFYNHFSKVIYTILIDHVRKSTALKRQPHQHDSNSAESQQRLMQFLDIELILKRLETDNPRQVAVFIYKYVCLMPTKEIAQLYALSESAVDKDLSFVKKLLSIELSQ